MWQNNYLRYYCNNFGRYFYQRLSYDGEDDYLFFTYESESPIVCCPDCNSPDTEMMPFEFRDNSYEDEF